MIQNTSAVKNSPDECTYLIFYHIILQGFTYRPALSGKPVPMLGFGFLNSIDMNLKPQILNDSKISLSILSMCKSKSLLYAMLRSQFKEGFSIKKKKRCFFCGKITNSKRKGSQRTKNEKAC